MIEFLFNDHGTFRPGHDFVNAASAEEARKLWEAATDIKW
jgi:hypothetical protein